MAARLNDLRAGAALALVALAVTACGRPTGDFGRAEPSFLHDTLLPAAGKLTAEYVRKEPVSGFPLTDDEIELRNRAWAFVRAPHVRDWWLDSLVEGERTRILPILKGGDAPSPEIVAMFPEIALPIIAPKLQALGLTASTIHRVSAFAATTLDSMPYSGSILMLLPMCHMKLKEVYPALFVTTVIATTVGTVSTAAATGSILGAFTLGVLATLAVVALTRRDD